MTGDRDSAPRSTSVASTSLAAQATPPRRGAERSVLVRPHLTEKSSILAERGQYTFIVTPGAEKVSVARAVAARYGVHPIHVAMVRIPGKRVRYGKTEGRRSDIKKAIVMLRPGEKIPFGVKA